MCCVPLFLTAALSWFLIAFHVLLSPTAGLGVLSANYWVPFRVCGIRLRGNRPLFAADHGVLLDDEIRHGRVDCGLRDFVRERRDGNALSEVLRRPNVRRISLTRCIIYLSDLLFGGRSRITLHWGIVVAGMAVFCLWIACRRIRAVEVG